MRAPLELWTWPTENGHKITIALEEMGLPYVIRPVNIGAGEQSAPAFLAVNPNGRIPAIVDPQGGDAEGPLTIFESGAILQYLAALSGRFHGANAAARARVDQWLFWQVGGLGPMGGQAHHFRNVARRTLPDQRHLAYGAARYTREVTRLYGVLEQRLRDRDFVAGDYSIADMAIWPWIRRWEEEGQRLADFPALTAWAERVGARPAVVRALEIGRAMRA